MGENVTVLNDSSKSLDEKIVVGSRGKNVEQVHAVSTISWVHGHSGAHVRIGAGMRFPRLQKKKRDCVLVASQEP